MTAHVLGLRAVLLSAALACVAAPSATAQSSRAGFVQMPSSGPGYFGYYASSKRWGTPRLVYGLQRAAAKWRAERPSGPRIGIGDISLMNGGKISGHVSHRKGVDVDVRPLRNDGREDRVTIHQRAYSRQLTKRVIQLMRAETPTTLVLFNDRNIAGTTWYRNHDNHFHLRIADQGRPTRSSTRARPANGLTARVNRVNRRIGTRRTR